jgi:hypothetical protein
MMVMKKTHHHHPQHSQTTLLTYEHQCLPGHYHVAKRKSSDQQHDAEEGDGERDTFEPSAFASGRDHHGDGEKKHKRNSGSGGPRNCENANPLILAQAVTAHGVFEGTVGGYAG